MPDCENVIYMDHHATTPVDPQVIEAMMPYMTIHFGNASNTAHSFGKNALDAVEKGRRQVAGLINCTPEEIVFTSGATESDNLAIKGIAHEYAHKGNHIITSTVEHHAVMDTCVALEEEGFEITYLPVDCYGMVRTDRVESAITNRTILISLIYANNEVGSINSISEIGKIARRHGVLFHSDAVQGLGKIDSDVDMLGLDLMSLTAHKIYGPKGIGALYIRQADPRIKLHPIMHGGGQEHDLRPGTLNVPGIVGFGEACNLSRELMAEESKRICALRNRLYDALLNEIEDIYLNGHPEKRLPGNLNISFKFVESRSLISGLNNIALSTGSACNFGANHASHVLLAMGLEEQLAHTAVRLGLGRYTTEEEVSIVIDAVVEAVARLRKLSPIDE